MPLLGLCDTTIAGHLGDTSFIGGIAVGTMMINVVFWCFGFLRMGTTGLTAQACGAGDDAQVARVFSRAFFLASGIGVVIVLLQWPLRELVLRIISPEAGVGSLAKSYFSTVIWGAPAMLATMSVSGWFLGMQSGVCPMVVAVATNVVNIGVSVLCAFGLDMGFMGTAIGTLTANWFGLLLALLLAWRFHGRKLPFCSLGQALAWTGMGRFFRVNSDIFLRSFCIMAVSMGVTAIGARLGSDILATNAVMMQFFILFSYFMDGFAFSAEALTGKCVGGGDTLLMGLTVRYMMLWGAAMALCFTLLYIAFYGQIGAFITDDPVVLGHLVRYRVFLFAIPCITVAAFIYDGIYIGLTATRAMLVVTMLSALVFFAINFIPVCGQLSGFQGNARLWTAFLSYLFVRGVGLCLLYRKNVRRVMPVLVK